MDPVDKFNQDKQLQAIAQELREVIALNKHGNLHYAERALHFMFIERWTRGALSISDLEPLDGHTLFNHLQRLRTHGAIDWSDEKIGRICDERNLVMHCNDQVRWKFFPEDLRKIFDKLWVATGRYPKYE